MTENTKSLDRFLTPEALAENEWVAGVTRQQLEAEFPDLPFSGVMTIDEDKLISFLQNHLQFRPRNEELERDESFKQLITYFLIKNDQGQYFTSQRKAKGGEARAHGAYLFGFGGHLRKEDIKGRMSDWLAREFDEEVKVGQLKEIKFIGLFNNDSDELQGVNRVHFGIVFEMTVADPVEIVEKDKFEEGKFMTLADIMSQHGDKLETWSRVIGEDLSAQKS